MKKKVLIVYAVLVFLFVFSVAMIYKTFANSDLIAIANISIQSKSENVEATSVNHDDTNVTSNAIFHNVGDYIIYKITLSNRDSKNYYIKSITDNNTNPYVTYEYTNDENELFKGSTTKDILIKITYKNAVDNVDNRVQLGNTKITFNLVAEDGEEQPVVVNPDDEGEVKGAEENPNPKTNDLLFIYLSINAIAIVGIVVVAKNKKAKTFIIVALLITPLVVKAFDLVFVATFNYEIKLFDKLVITTNINGETTTQVIGYNEVFNEPTHEDKNGYTFVGWVDSNNNIVNFDNPITSDTTITPKYNTIPYTISYELDRGTADNRTEYNVETDTFTLVNPIRQGYDFKGWSGTDLTGDENILVTIAKGSTGDRSYTANYTARNDTNYRVIHRYELLNGEYDEDIVDTPGVSDDQVTPPAIPRTGYDNPNLQTVTIDPSGNTEVTYTYTLKTYTLTISDRTYLTSDSSANGTYRHGEVVTLKAVPRTDYDFKWSDNNTSYNRSITMEGNKTLSLVYTYNKNIITFNALNGTCSESERRIAKGSAIGTLPTCTPPVYYAFVEWQDENDNTITSSYVPTGDMTLKAVYQSTDIIVSFDSQGGSEESIIVVHQGESVGTLPKPTKEGKIFGGWYIDLSTDSKVDDTYTPTDNITLHAKWDDYACIKATVLHTDVCKGSNASQGCRGAGFVDNEEYTYGNIISSDTLITGDALDCNVDGTGYNHRFYYLYNNYDGNAVLISYNNYQEVNGERGVGNTQNYTYSVAQNYLPTISEWPNLPITYNDKAARILEMGDLIEISGKTPTQLATNKALDAYRFLFENTSYTTTNTRSTYWVMDWTDGATTSRGRVHKNDRKIDVLSSSNYNSSVNSVRPVIEIPTEYIKDAYVIGFEYTGDVIIDQYMSIDKGSSIGTFPTVTNGTYVLDGWYADDYYVTKINASTIPSGYVTYYAKWVKSVEDADLQTNTFTMPLDSSDAIIINNDGELEEYTFTSNDESVVTVDENGNITAVGVGNTTITIEGITTGKTVTITVVVTAPVSTYTVEFDTQGGSSVTSMEVDKDTAIGTLPSTSKNEHTFAGWYTNTNYVTQVSAETVINHSMTLYAKWIPDSAVAQIGNTYYDTIQAAVDDAPTSKTTITVIKDVALTQMIDLNSKNTNKDIVLDLNGHTLSNNNNANINIINNKATLEVKNGTIQTNASGKGAIDVYSNNGTPGKLVINSGIINSTGGRAAIYNDGGIVEIGGTVQLTASADGSNTARRATVQTISGTTIITGGTIISDRASNSYGVSINAGTLVIGTQDGVYNKDALTIQANTTGIFASTGVTYSIYDGYIKGKTSAVNDQTQISGIEAGATKVTEPDDGAYKILYYELTKVQYAISLNPNGGTLDSNTLLVDMGDALSSLPVPTRGAYTFDGWFDTTTNTQVTTSTIPEGDMSLIAHWSYASSNEIQAFNMTNDVMSVYYDRIDTWSADQSTFQTNMDANFNAYNCKCNENTCSTAGTELCDKPKGYVVPDNNVTVYLSDENTKVKGDEVTYVTIKDGIIYNMIPGTTYYWESNDDSSVYGYVKAEGERRIINIDGVRNVRDLGGLKVDTNNDGTPDGTVAYGRLFRGEKLWNNSNNVTQLRKLGINEEVDLRAASERSSGEVKFDDNFKQREIKHYQLNFETQRTNYDLARNTVIEVMQDIINDDDTSIYFHCRIGTDRTGTLAYILEGLLGVTQEDMLRDYELSYFFGLVNRHRFFSYDATSSVSKDQKFVYMYDIMSNAQEVYEWFMLGSTNPDADNALINSFRSKMIE